MTSIIYENGRQTFSAASGNKVSLTSAGPAKIYKQVGYPNHPNSEQLLYGTQPGETYTSAAFSSATNVTIEAFAAPVYYENSSAPNIGLGVFSQGTPTAKTVSSTMTAGDIKAGLITVLQGAGAASAQQLPLATAMDTACPDFKVNDSFDFNVINLSTTSAESASITTNTGWTLVGPMDIAAYSAAGSLNSAAIFRARKTGTGTWTLYRVG